MQLKSIRQSGLTCLVQLLFQGLCCLIKREKIEQVCDNSLILSLSHLCGNVARASPRTHLALSESLTAPNQ